MSKKTNYIFIIGGVLSGLGKGVATSSIAKLLQSRGLQVTAMKIDPYINYDAGTMNPTEHGEVFVTKDGLETDQDVGNYERFLNAELSADNYMTQGMVWDTVMRKERNLEYQGKCVQPWYHIPAEIIRRIKLLGKKTKADVVLIEVGGTIGEYENLIFLEAGRRLRIQCPGQVLFIMVSYLPVPSKIGEMKTKPTQTAVQMLNTAGIQPDFILTRSTKMVDSKRKEKIAFFCNVESEDIISSQDVDSIYEVPLNYQNQNLDRLILKKLKLKAGTQDMRTWKRLIEKQKTIRKKINIALIGKYFSTGSFTLSDSYISVIEALKHAALANNVKVNFEWIDSENIEKGKLKVEELSKYQGVVVPGGFGGRGVEGIISAIEYVRKNNIPYLGLCYGMQLATVEFARHVAKLRGAHTTEINKDTKYPVIDVMVDQKEKLAEDDYGGTMRLGDYRCTLKKGSKSYQAYKRPGIVERHRHRYEFNNKFRSRLEKYGLLVAGINRSRNLVEIIELPEHPFFVGVQFHPEFKSRPLSPHPLFFEFIKTASLNK